MSFCLQFLIYRKLHTHTNTHDSHEFLWINSTSTFALIFLWSPNFVTTLKFTLLNNAIYLFLFSIKCSENLWCFFFLWGLVFCRYDDNTFFFGLKIKRKINFSFCTDDDVLDFGLKNMHDEVVGWWCDDYFRQIYWTLGLILFWFFLILRTNKI